MGLLELPDLRHTLVDIGTTLLCISGYNGLPGQTLPINLIHENARRSERVDNVALSSAVITTQKKKQKICRANKRVAAMTINDILALPIAVKSSRYKGNKWCFTISSYGMIKVTKSREKLWSVNLSMEAWRWLKTTWAKKYLDTTNNGNWKLLFDLELKMNGCEFIISMSLTLRKEFGLRTVLVQLFSKDR